MSPQTDRETGSQVVAQLRQRDSLIGPVRAQRLYPALVLH